MGDMISRQATIKAFEKRTHIEWEYLKTLNPVLGVIDDLPPISPDLSEHCEELYEEMRKLHDLLFGDEWSGADAKIEIIKCEDCKHGESYIARNGMKRVLCGLTGIDLFLN